MTSKCVEGQRIWNSRQGLPSGRKRAARLEAWQEHLSKCNQCQTALAEESRIAFARAIAQPILDWDREGAK